MNKLDLVGQRFGRLSVISEYSERTNAGKVQFVCLCDCGNTVISIGSHLKDGHTQSCSCIQKEVVLNLDNSTHKRTGTPIYTIWSSMKARCYNKSADSYHRYGGRGITVCDRWINSFENFLSDMGERPDGKMSIDRIDNEKGYSPENCRWATKYQQENNKSTNVVVAYNGELKTLAEWSRKLNVNYRLLHNRICRYNWSVADAFETPIIKKSA